MTAARRALEELLVHFPSYRTYTRLAGASATDARDMAWAMAGARRTMRRANLPVLDELGGVLLGEGLRAARPAERRSRLRAMVRFQQLSAPTAAKSVEDTAFYRYGRLLSRNEVGSDPTGSPSPPAGFHAAMLRAAAASSARPAGYRDPRPQARRGRPRPAGGAQRAAGGVGSGARAVDAPECAAQARGGRRRRRPTPPTS